MIPGVGRDRGAEVGGHQRFQRALESRPLWIPSVVDGVGGEGAGQSLHRAFRTDDLSLIQRVDELTRKILTRFSATEGAGNQKNSDGEVNRDRTVPGPRYPDCLSCHQPVPDGSSFRDLHETLPAARCPRAAAL